MIRASRIRPVPRLFAMLLLLLLGTLLSCSTTVSQERQQRISDCLATCEPGPPERAPFGEPEPGRDQRTDCERRCHQLR